jgi:hypothetical protein
MGERGWTDGNVLAKLKAPQSTKPHFDLIPDEVRADLFALFDSDTYLGSRNLAILAVLSDTGLRREEAANLVEKNVDLDAHTLRVYSDKVEEWRYIPLTDEAVAVLRNYLKWRNRYFLHPARPRQNGSENRRRRESSAVTARYRTVKRREVGEPGLRVISKRQNELQLEAVCETQHFVELAPPPVPNIVRQRLMDEHTHDGDAGRTSPFEILPDERGVKAVVIPHLPGAVSWSLVVDPQQKDLATGAVDKALTANCDRGVGACGTAQHERQDYA